MHEKALPKSAVPVSSKPSYQPNESWPPNAEAYANAQKAKQLLVDSGITCFDSFLSRIDLAVEMRHVTHDDARGAIEDPEESRILESDTVTGLSFNYDTDPATIEHATIYTTEALNSKFLPILAHEIIELQIVERFMADYAAKKKEFQMLAEVGVTDLLTFVSTLRHAQTLKLTVEDLINPAFQTYAIFRALSEQSPKYGASPMEMLISYLGPDTKTGQELSALTSVFLSYRQVEQLVAEKSGGRDRSVTDRYYSEESDVRAIIRKDRQAGTAAVVSMIQLAAFLPSDLLGEDHTLLLDIPKAKL